jgi:cobalt-zinc-cadmium efflux system protein
MAKAGMQRERFKSVPLLFVMGRIVLGGVFVWASWGKILDPMAFTQAIANYQIVPPALGNPAGLILPWVELVCGICLILNRWTRGSALITALLLVVFMGALGYNIHRGIDIGCGCFTLDEKAPGNMWLYLARDGAFLAVAVAVLCRPDFGAGPAAKPVPDSPLTLQ